VAQQILAEAVVVLLVGVVGMAQVLLTMLVEVLAVPVLSLFLEI